MAQLFGILYIFLIVANAQNDDDAFCPNPNQDEHEVFAYPVCPNIECKVSIFEYCAAASIGIMFEEYLTSKGFEHEGMRKEQNPNTKLRLALTVNTESIFCHGLFVQRSLLSLMNTQDPKTTGHAIDLISLLEKTELHRAIHDYPFWPESYFLGNKKERRQFMRQLPCEQQLAEPWILKSNQHKGKGIVFLDNTRDIRKLFITNDDLKYGFETTDDRLSHDCNPSAPVERFEVEEIAEFGFAEDTIDSIAHIVKGEHFIAQKYINDTVLIEGRKIGVRVFAVVLSLNPYIVLFSDGYISINAQVFDGSHINKENILSNREMSEKYLSSEDDEWNWNYQQFDEYIKKKQEFNFNFDDDVRSKLMNATKATFDAIDRDNGKYSKKTKKKLKKYFALADKKGILNKNDNNYLWLALDFLLTTDGNVKLLEINLHPGTRLFNHCSWNNVEMASYEDWRCQQSRNITKEIVDVSFAMAYRKKMDMLMDREWLEQQIDFHKCLIYNDYI